MQARNLLAFIKQELNTIDINQSEIDAEAMIIFTHCTGLKLLDILENKIIAVEIIQKINDIIAKRKTSMPLAYILKQWHFYGNDFIINESCLIPRLDSEIIIEKTYNLLINLFIANASLNIVDVCSGSGCLGITLVNMLSERFSNLNIHLTMLDISDNVLEISQQNGQEILKNKARYISKKFDVLSDNFDIEIFNNANVIISNPPYIPTKDINNLEKQVKDFEPKIALDGGSDGLIFYHKIANGLKNSCFSGLLSCEFGINQAKDIANIFQNANFDLIDIYQDLCHIERCALFQKIL